MKAICIQYWLTIVWCAKKDILYIARKFDRKLNLVAWLLGLNLPNSNLPIIIFCIVSFLCTHPWKSSPLLSETSGAPKANKVSVNPLLLSAITPQHCKDDVSFWNYLHTEPSFGRRRFTSRYCWSTLRCKMKVSAWSRRRQTANSGWSSWSHQACPVHVAYNLLIRVFPPYCLAPPQAQPISLFVTPPRISYLPLPVAPQTV